MCEACGEHTRGRRRLGIGGVVSILILTTVIGLSVIGHFVTSTGRASSPCGRASRAWSAYQREFTADVAAPTASRDAERRDTRAFLSALAGGGLTCKSIERDIADAPKTIGTVCADCAQSLIRAVRAARPTN